MPQHTKKEQAKKGKKTKVNRDVPGGDLTDEQILFVARHTNVRERADIIRRTHRSPGAKDRTLKQKRKAASIGFLSRARRNQREKQGGRSDKRAERVSRRIKKV